MINQIGGCEVMNVKGCLKRGGHGNGGAHVGGQVLHAFAEMVCKDTQMFEGFFARHSFFRAFVAQGNIVFIAIESHCFSPFFCFCVLQKILGFIADFSAMRQQYYDK